MNPSLINCCTIDWYAEWDKEAMLAVANMYFQSVEFVAEDTYNIEVCTVFVAVHVHIDIHIYVKKHMHRNEEMHTHTHTHTCHT